jgi:hypothetical protein
MTMTRAFKELMFDALVDASVFLVLLAVMFTLSL